MTNFKVMTHRAMFQRPSVAHSEVKLKQNTETAWNNFRLVSASLAYLIACWTIFQWGWNKPKTVSVCFSVLFQFYFRMCDGRVRTYMNIWKSLALCGSKNLSWKILDNSRYSGHPSAMGRVLKEKRRKQNGGRRENIDWLTSEGLGPWMHLWHC